MSSLFDPGYCTTAELRSSGFKAVGEGVRIARNCTIIGVENISIGDRVRIDGYCTIVAPGSGSARLGSHIHIGGYCLLSAGDGIVMDDFSGLSLVSKSLSHSMRGEFRWTIRDEASKTGRASMESPWAIIQSGKAHRGLIAYGSRRADCAS